MQTQLHRGHREAYYVEPGSIDDGELTLSHEESHHLANVNRTGIGEEFIAVNGRGSAFQCRITEIGKVVRARIVAQKLGFGEPRFQLTLAVGVPKKNRFEWIVEKGTEIGVVEFVPLLTKRTVVKRSSVHLSRLNRICIAAIKQCYRSALPTINQPTGFESLCHQSAKYDLKIILHEEAGGIALDAVTAPSGEKSQSSTSTGLVLVGPEGGFTESEVNLAQERGFKKVWFGQRRLRTETAALAIASVVLDRMSEFR